MQTLDDLIARLESAEEGSRELDADVAVATRSTLTTGDKDLPAWADKNFSEWRARSDGRVETVHTDGTGGLNWTPGAFTTSLDAALTLVPEGWFTQLRGPWKDGMHMADIASNPFIDTCHEREDGQDGYAASGPLALTIAALKARKALEDT